MNWMDLVSAHKLQLILAGIAGGLVRWLTLKEPWPALLPSVIVGALVSVYLGPTVSATMAPVLAFVMPDGANEASLGGFLAGIAGLTLSGFVIDFWNARRKGLAKPGNDTKGN